MLRGINILLTILLLAACVPAAAQYSNLRLKKVSTQGVITLDSLSLVPHSVKITGYDTSFYRLDEVNSTLLWQKAILADSVMVHYRVFPSRLNSIARRFSFDSVKNNFIAQRPSMLRNSTADNGLLNFGNVNYNGSFGRSLSVGNTQDAVFNSQLNLQISGLIGDSIQVAAAITDNNLPIQPDGTTQQLNEFDRILLQFKKKDWEINLGDIDLRQNDAYFLKFYKRLQGIQYQQIFKINKTIENKLLLSGALAKGKFARNILLVQEGNQGPYRLQGNNNELFFIVLAGTEKVFVDGVQVQRGDDQDYIINYNTAEVIFTARRMITKDTRVQVEFEYADRNFLNTMLYASNTTKFNNRFTLHLAAYSNADAKNAPVNQTLNAPQKQFLAGVGDSIQQAFYPVAATDSFSATQIFYKKIDTLYNGTHDSVYVYSTNRDSAKYRLSFVETGANRGNYIPAYAAANGKVYQWVAPVNGVPQGYYEAAQFLVSPKKQQVVSVGGEYQISKNTTAKAEMAMSKYDVNTFSSLQKNNDVGYAGKLQLAKQKTWKNNGGKTYNLAGTAGYEWVDKNFKPVERLRAVEFLRDWGLGWIAAPAAEQLSDVSVQLTDDQNNLLQYRFNSYTRSDGYKGFRNSISHRQDIKGWQLRNELNITNIAMPHDRGFYLRPTLDVSKTFTSLHNYTAGAAYAVEHNEIRNIIADTVTPVSFAFETLSAYIKSNQEKENKWAFTYFTRKNRLPYGNTLAQSDRSNNYNLQADLLGNSRHQVRLNATYRQLYISNVKLSSQLPDNSLLGRIEYNINEWNGLLTGNALYEIGAGQEQKREYSYVEVPAGMGQYAWIDYNNDNIPQLNEFETALFQDQAKYIRIFTPSNQYIKAGYNQLNYSVALNPKVLAQDTKNKLLKNVLSRLFLQSLLQAGTKQLAGGQPVYSPFSSKLTDTSLLTLNYLVSNNLAFNRGSAVWGAEVTQLVNYNKALLTYGFETRRLQQWSYKMHMNFFKAYTIEMAQTTGINSLLTPAFENRNYHIQFFSIQPKIKYTAGTNFRLQGGYEWKYKKNNAEYGGEIATNNALHLESRLNLVNNTSLLAKFTANSIQFNGLANTAKAYMMLEGLLPGRNYLWSINFTKRLVNNLEVNVEYEGRKPGTARTVNIGRASIRALL